MLVKAIASGFYGGVRRREGDVFEVKSTQKSKWFEPVDTKSSAVDKTKTLKKLEPVTISELNKRNSEMNVI